MRVATALISFIDGSYLFVELAKKVDTRDACLFCHKINGLPEGTPADKPTIAASILRLGSSTSVEVIIPMARVNGVNIMEEFLAKQVSKDIQDMWEPPAAGAGRPGGGGKR